METQLINRVAGSGLTTINLEDFFPKNDFFVFDISQFLLQGFLLKEKEFRASLKEWNWSEYKNKVVLIQCNTDAIIPMWAYMLIAQYLSDISSDIYVGNENEYTKSFFYHALKKEDWSKYAEQRIVVKGCGHRPVPEDAYARITFLLMPYAKAIMFGEPCSTVPVYKKR